jgi:YfiR/HmsC-like
MPRLTNKNRTVASLRPAGRRAALAALLAIIVASGHWPRCWAQADVQSAEYKVKAAFLYKFASYIEWPSEVFERPESPIVIGVAGADALSDELAQVVTGRSIGGRPVEVRKLRRGTPLNGLQILFVGRSDRGSPDVLASAKGRPVLTVTESEDAFALGSMINFVIVDERVRFDVALREAEMANLRVSARLLRVARRVLGGPS